jgi:hypothetical protein
LQFKLRAHILALVIGPIWARFLWGWSLPKFGDGGSVRPVTRKSLHFGAGFFVCGVTIYRNGMPIKRRVLRGAV